MDISNMVADYFSIKAVLLEAGVKPEDIYCESCQFQYIYITDIAKLTTIRKAFEQIKVYGVKPHAFHEHLSEINRSIDHGYLTTLDKGFCFYACSANCIKTLEFILPAVSINIMIGDRTLLMWACQWNATCVACRLIELGINVNAVTTAGNYTALHIAVGNCDRDMDELIEATDLTIRCEHGDILEYIDRKANEKSTSDFERTKIRNLREQVLYIRAAKYLKSRIRNIATDKLLTIANWRK